MFIVQPSPKLASSTTRRSASSKQNNDCHSDTKTTASWQSPTFPSLPEDDSDLDEDQNPTICSPQAWTSFSTAALIPHDLMYYINEKMIILHWIIPFSELIITSFRANLKFSSTCSTLLSSPKVQRGARTIIQL
ncbi:hypothetical protein PM082_007956 [Marasmius tenuissimus]|nr:hypothetical protein PM082_007956 [Marasmius tenuissimus]